MSISTDDAALPYYCEILCERYLINTLTMSYTNDCSKRLFNPLGGKHDY
jgi:hypothetical protein